MKLKLFKKYFFTTAIIIMFSLTAMMMILSVVLNNYITKSKYETLTKACNEVSEHIASITSEQKYDSSEFFNILTTVADVSDADIFIADISGKVTVCGCGEWNENRSCTHSAAKLQGYNDFEDKKIRLDRLGIYEKPHYVAFAELTRYDGEVLGKVYATSSVSVVKNLLSTVSQLYFFSAIIPIIIMNSLLEMISQ